MNVKINDKQANWTTEDKTNDPTFDENKFLTICLTVAFDEIFRWRNFFAVQYTILLYYQYMYAWHGHLCNIDRGHCESVEHTGTYTHSLKESRREREREREREPKRERERESRRERERERESRIERERERERERFTRCHVFFFSQTSRGTAKVLSVCQRKTKDVCVFSSCLKKTLCPLFWEGDGGQMTSQGSYLKRRLWSTHLLLVALLLLVLPHSELFSAVKLYARKPQRHVFFGVNVGAPSSLPGFLLFLCRTSRCLSLNWNRYSKFPSFPFFFFSKMCDLYFSSKTSATPCPRFKMR